MKRLILITLTFFWLNANSNLNGQVVLNELAFGGFLGDFVEIKNTGSNTVDVSEYWFFTTSPGGIPAFVQLNALTLGCGDLILEEGEIIVFNDISSAISWLPDLGELALYSTNINDFENPANLVDYVSWGLAPTSSFTLNVALAAGQWQGGDFVDGNYDGLSIEYDGTGDSSSDWPFNNMPTICTENDAFMNACNATAGTTNVMEYEFCVGDGIADQALDLIVSGNIGSFSQWVITDPVGTILEIPANLSEIDFDTAPGGLCLIWHVAHEENISGLALGAPVLMMQGCHAVSDPIIVVRNEVDGGVVTGGPFDFCVGDGVPDFVSGVSLSGTIGAISQWVVTDEQGIVLDFPTDPALVDFDAAPAGICLIRNISHLGVTGLDLGLNINEVQGCHDLSNAVVVNRHAPSSPECGGPTTSTVFALIGLENLLLEHGIVHQGGLGVTSETGDIEISKSSNVTAEESFVNAMNVDVNKGSKVNSICAIPATPQLPGFMYNTTTTNDDVDVDVATGEVVVLTESIYEDIDIEDGATVTFSGQGFVYIEELDIEDNVTILFDQCTNLIISKKLSIGKYNNFNPGEENVFVFAEEDAEVKKGSTVYAGIYTLGDLKIRKADEENPTLLYGLFIGEEVKALGYVEIWGEEVTPCEPSFSGFQQLANQNQEQVKLIEERSGTIALDAPEMFVYPNPAKKVAFLKMKTEKEQNIQIKIYNITNTLVSEQNDYKSNDGPIELNINNLAVGLYTVHVTMEDGTIVSQSIVVQ